MGSLIIAGVANWAARRYALPFGAIAFLVTIPNVLIALMIDASPVYVALPLVASLVSGFAADVAVAKRGSGTRDHPSWRSRTFAFGLPFAFWTTYMLAAYIALGPFWWSLHEVFGAPVNAGLAGLLSSRLGEERNAKTAP